MTIQLKYTENERLHVFTGVCIHASMHAYVHACFYVCTIVHTSSSMFNVTKTLSVIDKQYKYPK